MCLSTREGVVDEGREGIFLASSSKKKWRNERRFGIVH